MKTYLGDGVYAETTKFGEVKLTTEVGDPEKPTNVIILEDDMIERLYDWWKRSKL